MDEPGTMTFPLDQVTRWFEELPAAVFVSDDAGTPLYANRMAKQLLGEGVVDLTPDRLAETYQAFVAGTDEAYPTERLPIARALAGETSIVDDIEIRHPERTISLEIRGAPIHDSEGAIKFAVAVFSDISERKEAESELDEKAHFLDLTQDAIMKLDLAYVIRYWNRAAEERYGWSKEEALGKVSYELLHTKFPQPLTEVRAELERNGRWEGELTRTARDGKNVLVASRWALHRDEMGNPMYFLEVNNDISAQKAVEEALHSAREEAERANLAKSEFLSRMSHELRTPLNSILGFSQLLEMDKLQPDQFDSVEQIIKGGRRLLELINEVLDISRIESGQLRLSLEPVQLADVINESISLVRPLADEREIRLETVLSGDLGRAHVWADRQRLGQVLLNLLSNAIKYNVRQGLVTIAGAFDAEERVRISVTDSGPGVPEDRLPLLFVPFERLGAETSSVEGTGLGLALSKSLVEAMGGRIAVDSVRGQGTTLWVELRASSAPTKDTEAPKERIRPEPAIHHDRKVVLYIEDNLSNLKLVERLLEFGPNVQLISAMTATLGIDLALQHIPDLILLDLHLPDLPGDEALLRLRRDPKTAQIPIVMLSADASPNEIKRLLATGADHYLTKPLDIDAFLAVLNRIIGSSDSPS